MKDSASLDTELAALRQATGRRFWRGLDELIARPAIRAEIERRFPSIARAASDWRRRDILKCLGGALALAGLDGCERVPDGDALPFVEQPEGEEPGIARYYATAVEIDGVAQPVIGKTRMGRPIKLEGNPSHPASRGATDAFTQAALLDLYDPERSPAPLHAGELCAWTKVDTALAALRNRLDAVGGAGFALLTGPIGSPTLFRQISEIAARWPKARWYRYTTQAGPNGTHGHRHLSLDRTHAVVAFDDDPIGPGPHQTYHAGAWAERRRAYQSGDGRAEMFVAEPSPTLSGVAATERLVSSEARIAVLLAALARRLGLDVSSPSPLNSREQAWIERVAEALSDARGRGLVTVGAHHPPALRQLALRIDAALGNSAPALSPMQEDPPAAGDIDMLATAIGRGGVETLMVFDANPLYEAGGSQLDARFDEVPLRIHAGLHADETALRCHWHMPLAHLLESWSDGSAADGSTVIVQPLVRPWRDVRSRHGILASLTGEDRTDRDIVRTTWKDRVDDDGWQKALLAGTIAPPIERERPAASEVSDPIVHAGEVRLTGLSLLIRPDPTLWTGRMASNPWLQELPKPLTKICWGNAVHISPALAREMDIANEDMVRLSVGDASITGPAWILPGQERRTILVHRGHGRSAGGRVAAGVGFDVAPLAVAQGPVKLEKIDGRQRIATTQHHFAMEDDEFVRYVATAADRLPAEPPPSNFFPPQHSQPAWGMAIDLDLCIGCNACVVACVAENNIPMVGKDQVAMGREMHWLRVDRYYRGSADEPEHAFQPVPCMHCEDAPCEMGCPVNATVHSDDGLNLQVYNRCIGTRTCSAYCPYKVRRFNWFDLTGGDPPELKAQRNPEVTVRGRGVMEKCTYCIQRISAARIEAKKADRPIGDGEVVTACQAACPTQAIVFGDIADEKSAVNARKTNGRDYPLLREANTRPRTTYQARILRGDRA